MNPLEWLHQRGVMTRRVSVLSGHIAPLFPYGCRILDVGCGDGARTWRSRALTYWPAGRCKSQSLFIRTLKEWQGHLDELDVSVNSWTSELGLYPWPANLLFDRSLHFIADLDVV